MPVRHRQQQAKFKLLNGKFIFYILFLLWVNLDKAFRFGKRFSYTIFLRLAITIFYNHFFCFAKFFAILYILILQVLNFSETLGKFVPV